MYKRVSNAEGQWLLINCARGHRLTVETTRKLQVGRDLIEGDTVTKLERERENRRRRWICFRRRRRSWPNDMDSGHSSSSMLTWTGRLARPPLASTMAALTMASPITFAAILSPKCEPLLPSSSRLGQLFHDPVAIFEHFFWAFVVVSSVFFKFRRRN